MTIMSSGDVCRKVCTYL